jgi:hypothetical protein
VGRQFKFNAVSAAIALSILPATLSFAQGPPQGPGQHGIGRNHKFKGATPGVRERWSALPPDERQVFTKNAERWLRMSPDEQKVLREREKVYRQQLQKDAEQLMRQSGLRLDQDARERFESRYWQERRKIERDLRKEIEVRRQQQLPVLSERLKSEFQSRPSPNGRSTSTPSSGPQH